MSDAHQHSAPNFTLPPKNYGTNDHASSLLLSLIAEAPSEVFTLAWLIGNLRHRSFSIIMLVLAIIAMVPVGISIPVGLLIIVLSVQIIRGHRNATLPNRLMNRPLSSRYLRLLEQYLVPMLIHLETFVRPRWPAIVNGTAPIATVAVLLLALMLITVPLPLVNIPVAGTIALIALAQTEHDGLLLSFALVVAAFVLSLALVAILGLVDGAEWIVRR